jgi:hypothetical protein
MSVNIPKLVQKMVHLLNLGSFEEYEKAIFN